jgi:KH domain
MYNSCDSNCSLADLSLLRIYSLQSSSVRNVYHYISRSFSHLTFLFFFISPYPPPLPLPLPHSISLLILSPLSLPHFPPSLPPDATGVEINTPKVDRDSTAPMVITVTGTADGVARATKAINELVTKGYCKLLASDDFKEGSIEVHPKYVLYCTLCPTVHSYLCMIYFHMTPIFGLQNRLDQNGAELEITCMHLRYSNMIHAANLSPCLSTLASCHSYYFHFFHSLSYIKDIIGKGGANIRAIQDFTGVKLAIPQVPHTHSFDIYLPLLHSLPLSLAHIFYVF